MRTAHSVEQVRAAERALMAQLPPGALMQRAAAGLAAACADYLGRVYGSRVLVVAGGGDNGGDGLFAAAQLARRGAAVDVIAVADRVHEAGMAAVRRAGGRVVERPRGADLVLDAVVGIGGRPGLSGRAAELAAALTAPVVAVDVPSGVGIDTGELSGPHFAADLTVTFGTLKPALLLDPAAAAAGSVELVDIGLGPWLDRPVLEALQAADVRRLLPRPGPDAQKYSRGVVGIRAGSRGYTGAGVLVVGGALRTGLAGMVRYAGASADLVRQRYPEVVIGEGRVQAWVVGSGLGAEASEAVHSVLAVGLPTVVDADGLGQLPDRCRPDVVLTPHAGELARMLRVDRAEVEERTYEHARRAAERWGAVVLLKGNRSVVAAPDGRARVNTTGIPWLATAGAGDVLSGVVGALLAAGLEPFDAASVGAWLHGAAAMVASAGGAISAADVASRLPDAVRSALTP